MKINVCSCDCVYIYAVINRTEAEANTIFSLNLALHKGSVFYYNKKVNFQSVEANPATFIHSDTICIANESSLIRTNVDFAKAVIFT